MKDFGRESCCVMHKMRLSWEYSVIKYIKIQPRLEEIFLLDFLSFEVNFELTRIENWIS